MKCDTRALTTSTTLLTHFATVDLAAGALPEPFEMSGKAIWRLLNARKRLAAGALPRTPLEGLTAFPRPLAGGEETGCPLPKNPILALGHSGLACPCH